MVVDRGTLVRCRMTRPSTSAVLPTVTAAVPRTHPQLEAVLTQEAGLDGTGRLLDVGCGPGVLTVRLAPLFDQAVGLDPDADMLAEGSRAAGESRVMNIRWVQGLAGPARGRARAVPAGGLWPVLPAGPTDS